MVETTLAPNAPLEDALRAYFEATSGAHDAGERTLAHLASDDVGPCDRDALRALFEPAALAAWDDDMATIEGAWAEGAAPSAPAALANAHRRRHLLGIVGGVILAAAAVALLVARPSEPEPRFKGGPTAGASEWSLQIGVKRGDRRFILGSGGTLKTQDQLGFFYSAAAAGHLMIAYVDADGAIVRLFPRDSDLAKNVPAGREVRLDAGATLTGGAGCEWVVGALGAEPYAFADLAADLREARADGAPCALPLADTPARGYRAVLIHR